MNSASSSQPPKHLDPSAQEFHPTPNLFIPTPLFPFPPPPPPHLLLPYLHPPPPTAYFHLIPPPTPLQPLPPPTTTTTGTNATVEDSVSSLGNVSVRNDSVLNRNVVREVVCGVGGNKQQKQGVGRSNRSLMDLKFMIKEDVITGSGDSRTTLMIKNIPNKYSQELMLSLLDNHCARCNDQILSGQGGVGSGCLSSYDSVYLPVDFNNKCNVDYGFVNMTSPEATMRLYKAFHRQSWEVFNSRKICEVTYARVQGLQALKEHFRNSKFPSGSDEIFLVVFEPSRDGRRQLTPPQPIYGLTTAGSSENESNTSSSSSSGRSNVGSYEQYSNESSQGGVDEVFSDLRPTC